MTTKKTILITRATDGVGTLRRRALAREGRRVIVQIRDRARGESAVDWIAKRGCKARSPAGAVQRETYGLDALVNNARAAPVFIS